MFLRKVKKEGQSVLRFGCPDEEKAQSTLSASGSVCKASCDRTIHLRILVTLTTDLLSTVINS